MELNSKTIGIGIFVVLLLGVGLVGASGYFNMAQLHETMMGTDDFTEMHNAMMNGDFEAAEEYHKSLDFECPMHDLVRDGDVSLEDFQTMHNWMISGDFPTEKPDGLSDAAWALHVSHHPDLYK